MIMFENIFTLKEILISISFVLLFFIYSGRLIKKDSFSHKHKLIFVFFVLIKICFCFYSSAYLIFEKLDALTYSRIGLEFTSLIIEKPFEALKLFLTPSIHFSSNQNLLTQILGITYVISFKSYFGSNLLICLAGIIVQWKVFKLICTYFKTPAKYLSAFFLFIPSVLIWTSSSHVKETYIFISLLAILIVGLKFLMASKIKVSEVFYALFAIYFIYVTREFSFYLIVLLSLFTFLLFTAFRSSHPFRLLFIYALIVIVSLNFIPKKVANQFFHSAKDRREAMKIITQKTDRLLIKSKIETKKNYKELVNLPIHVSNTLFRPWIWEEHKKKLIIIKLESLIVFILTVFAIIRLFYKRHFHLTYDPIIVLFLSFSLLYAFIIGLSSLNYGASMRYRTLLLPFLMSALIHLIYSSVKIRKNA